MEFIIEHSVAFNRHYSINRISKLSRRMPFIVNLEAQRNESL